MLLPHSCAAQFGLLPQDLTTSLSAEIRAGAMIAPQTPDKPNRRQSDQQGEPEDRPPKLRQATALIIEIDDFTDIAAHFATEAAAELLNRYFTVVDESVVAFGGMVTDHVADSAMALFGMIEAHEDDADRALHAAVAIREGCREISDGLAPIVLRMAIATGQVLSAKVGSVHFQKHTATGEVVNLAWWMAQNAPPGDLLVAEETRQTLRNPAEMMPTDLPRPAPGQSGVIWALSDSASIPEDTAARPFVGRRLEQRQIESLLEACQECAMGHVLVIRGEAGIGKSRLTDWTSDQARRHGFGFNVGKVFDFGTASSRHVVTSLVLDLLDVPRDAPQDVRRKALRDAVSAKVIRPEDEILVTNLFNLPMSEQEIETYAALGGETRLAARKIVLASLVRWRVKENPVMVVIDDVHWADDVTIDVLADLAASLRDCPILLVMTTRVEDDPIDVHWRVTAGGVPVTTIDLGPLSASESEILAQS
ncbi:MAG: AAA family ATPase [Alphaproteobacteria bacterium]|nr:AAA family ATPase [Alphaproteobacteria bacterium]